MNESTRFWTVLHYVKSPVNAGMLIRSSAALGGEGIVAVGPEAWQPKKRAQTFSRRLERLSEFTHFEDDDGFFAWCAEQKISPIAIEIAEPTTFLPGYSFPQRCALIVGSEGKGIPKATLERCDAILTIPQHGPVACLNVAASGVIAMYELMRSRPASREVRGQKFEVTEEERGAIGGRW